MKTLRLLFGISALALLLVASPVLAAEVDVTGENNTTGADSDNENSFDVENDVDYEVDNDGDVDNDADADVDTGDNEQNRNTTGGDLTSGAVDASTLWESIVNEGTAMVGSASDGLDVKGNFGNDTTGADSDNENELDVENDLEYSLDNMADIDNDLDFDAETGDNEQNRNTTAGDLKSGGIGLDSIIGNWANNDAYGGSSAAAPEVSVDVDGNNEKTGADSDNENSFDIENEFDYEIDNDADIDNDIDVDADTGGNEQNRNTTGGDLESGDIEVETEIINSANNGSGGSATAGGDLSVEGEFSNDTTGADSNNENELDVENDVEYDVDNDADVDNDFDVDADTGDNEQNRNTEGGDVSSGDVTINFSAGTLVNSN